MTGETIMKKIILPAAVILIAAAIALFLLIRGAQKPETVQQPEIRNQETQTVPDASDDVQGESAETAEKTEADAEDNAAATAEEQRENETKEQPFLVQITEDDPSIAYVLVRMQNSIGLLPLPLEGEYSRTLRQKMPDGSEYVNVLHVTPKGFLMEDANCEGHDCVNQGEVTLENREERILWNMVICLPHQVSAELITREEAEQMLQP